MIKPKWCSFSIPYSDFMNFFASSLYFNSFRHIYDILVVFSLIDHRQSFPISITLAHLTHRDGWAHTGLHTSFKQLTRFDFLSIWNPDHPQPLVDIPLSTLHLPSSRSNLDLTREMRHIVCLFPWYNQSLAEMRTSKSSLCYLSPSWVLRAYDRYLAVQELIFDRIFYRRGL